MKSILYSKFWENTIFVSSLVLLFYIAFGSFIAERIVSLNYLFLNLLYLGVVWISLLLFAISCFLFIIKILINKAYKEYEAGADLESWYQETIQHLGLKWCEVLIDKISVVLSKSHFTFLSPSANKGTYEKAMFLRIAKSHSAKFIISDLAKIEDFEPCCEEGSSSYIYYPQTDAHKIFNMINGQVDIIYDIKGALWHTRLKGRLIKLYYHKLSPEGLLIIDNNKKSRIRSALSIFIYKLFKIIKLSNIFYRVEPSTFQKMYFSRITLWKLFDRLDDIEVLSNNNNTLTFSVYKKK